ncbi:ABC transporter permease subunit [Xylanimonas allomyrinae]|uniref:ABC transporter permease subunit n=1 Tax=Xylanimonas allomyrinae TaxID=2509459 RepID=A0A4P6EVM5_9MICO|nr:ABC transporter permease subunit [Xylanimonas allomyrinae]QAY62088.1 ABC transporter permease subunit [Xylanimonas allomyrinae]
MAGSAFARKQRQLTIPFVVGALALYTALFILPSAYSVYASLTDWNGIDPPRWVGLRNYAMLAEDPVFRQAVVNTAWITLGVGSVLFVLSFVVILVMRELRFVRFVRGALFLPHLVSTIVLAIFWAALFRYDGLLNSLLGALHVGPVTWMGPDSAFWLVLLGLVWIHLGYYVTILMAGVDAIPRHFYEAAFLDGAGPWQRFRHVTLPLAWDVVGVAAILWTISSVKIFEFILAFSGGRAPCPPSPSGTRPCSSTARRWAAPPRRSSSATRPQAPSSRSRSSPSSSSCCAVRCGASPSSSEQGASMRFARPAPRARRVSPTAQLDGGPLHGVVAVLVWLTVLFSVGALAFVVLSAFKSSAAIVANPWSLPDGLHLENWRTAWVDGNLGHGFRNSALLVATVAVATVVVAAPAAYVLSRRSGWAINATVVYFVLGLGIPMQVIVLPLYALMLRLGLISSLSGLFVMYVVVNLPFTVFLLTGFFGSLPSELEDAAALDGLSPNRTFWSIMLPLARGGLTTAMLLTGINVWNETFLALMFIQTNDKYTLPLSILNYYQQQQYSGSDYGALFAAASISILPMIVLYAWCGRRLTIGITSGALK